ncbi:methyltransferase domain-containing protein [Streptodolium elevatio]|uniref:Protein-L-isoaspartate O-methyltransferase n=1 Tax=Streptodolium elevatio TaxID=3157996 RepID=A0ABV3DR31_9ACTN
MDTNTQPETPPKPTSPSAASLAALLTEADVMPPGWAAIFAAVPRAVFVPDLVWAHDPATGAYTALDRSSDPDAWTAAVYGNTALVTQWDDGDHTGPEPGRLATSSASMPSVVADMLYDLKVSDGDRVLDVGTGTGWTAALLAARLGVGQVVTVEVDPLLAEQARANLARAGLPVAVVTGDGAEGWPDGAPYDLVHVTAGTRTIAPAWLAQTRPGGRIVAPWGTDYTPHDALVALTVHDPAHASGPFTVAASFMKLRDQRPTRRDHAAYAPPGWTDRARVSTPGLTLEEVTGGAYDARDFAVGLAVPHCAKAVSRDADATTVWLYGLPTAAGDAGLSVAAATFPRDTAAQPAAVWQAGPRNLWDEVEAAHAWWTDLGKPEVYDFGLTVIVADDGTVRHTPWHQDTDHPVPAA